jgi:peptidoglycan lytic transglycosylase A
VEAPPLFDDAPLDSLAEALDRDLEALSRQGETAAWRLGEATCSIGALRQSLGEVREILVRGEGDTAAFLDHLRRRFAVYRSAGRAEGTLFTGYYEPLLRGRRHREGAFVYPLYGKPSDLLAIPLGDFDAQWAGVTLWARVERGKLAPYHSRREIDAEGALAGRDLEIAWVDDPVALYFLHVQGSGILELEDGSTRRLGFAGSNGRPYTSIGRILADDGSLGGERPTAPAIQRYLREHPERRDEVLFRNERYVFFRETPQGPVGRLGATLTAGRSIAVDVSLYPLGGLAYIDTSVPVVGGAGEPAGTRPLRRLVLAQDTGAAISGPGRVDVFFGSGDRAGLEAGSLASRGELFFLVPRDCTG